MHGKTAININNVAYRILQNINNVVYRILQKCCKRIFKLSKVSFYAKFLAAHHLPPWKKYWRRPFIKFYTKNQLSSSSPSVMKLLLKDCQLTMRHIPEAAHCDSVGHVLHRVMCTDKLKLLSKQWMIYIYINMYTIANNRKCDNMPVLFKIRSSSQPKLRSGRYKHIEFCYCLRRSTAERFAPSPVL
jgi:hypothetical protein